MEIINNGFSAREIFIEQMKEFFENEEDVFKEFTTIKGKDLDILKNNINELEELDKIKEKDAHKRGELSYKKGMLFENTVRHLLESTGILNLYGNIGTATNEIDILVTPNFKGERLVSTLNQKDIKTLVGFEDYMIIECKNYNKKVPATYIGKFYTLLKTCCNCEVGIMFSYKGLTGNVKSWTDAHGLTKIINCLTKRECRIIEFNKEDFEKIINGENFFDLIKQKKLSLDIGANLEDFRIPHQNEASMRELVEKNV